MKNLACVTLALEFLAECYIILPSRFILPHFMYSYILLIYSSKCTHEKIIL
jgi:hypothetical protein